MGNSVLYYTMVTLPWFSTYSMPLCRFPQKSASKVSVKVAPLFVPGARRCRNQKTLDLGLCIIQNMSKMTELKRPLQIYAIKRITLDAKNKAMTKKLMREVKLLSRLNHENVVRSV